MRCSMRVAHHFPRESKAASAKLCQSVTLPETNIATENRPSQKETHLPTIHFQVLCWFWGGLKSQGSIRIPDPKENSNNPGDEFSSWVGGEHPNV